MTRIASSGVLRVAGVDARAFLQGQLSNDLGLLTPTTSLLASYNTPQGRVIAIPRLIQREQELLAILPRELIGKVTERLRRYVLRAKVTLADASDEFLLLGMLDSDAPESTASESRPGAHALDGAISWVRMPGAAPRHLLLGPVREMQAALQRLPRELPDDEEWRAGAIAAGEPQVYTETSELFVAQMLNLDLIDALSFSKGCYTGQEIITRTQHLGRIKRRMLRFRLQADVEVQRGDSVTLTPGGPGRVVERARNAAGEVEILAVVSVVGEVAASAAASALSAVPLPLPYAIPGADRDPSNA
ncbi:MAG TPA: hypothetical protein VEZ88_04405 [Steroidobacteraceae bacterium]|nr:hypothetical protein [Steroidobacteraceae bacterium]